MGALWTPPAYAPAVCALQTTAAVLLVNIFVIRHRTRHDLALDTPPAFPKTVTRRVFLVHGDRTR